MNNHENNIENVLINEDDFLHLFSQKEDSYPFIRYYDDKLKGMYDHNYFYIDNEMNEDILSSYKKYQELRKEYFMKISSPIPQPFLLSQGFEEEVILTMMKDDEFDIRQNEEISFTSFKENPQYVQAMVDFEILYYAKIYGLDFCKSRWDRYITKAKENDNGLNFFFALKNEKVIGYCYAFYSNDSVGVDSLLVQEEERHRGVAINLLKYVQSYYGCPIYLHAEEGDYPEQIYLKLGFETISKSYDYLLINK